MPFDGVPMPYFGLAPLLVLLAPSVVRVNHPLGGVIDAPREEVIPVQDRTSAQRLPRGPEYAGEQPVARP
jgi:hypothetical protein